MPRRPGLRHLAEELGSYLPTAPVRPILLSRFENGRVVAHTQQLAITMEGQAPLERAMALEVVPSDSFCADGAQLHELIGVMR